MAENDIYNSKAKYENFKKNLELFGVKPELRKIKNNSKAKYYCKNKINLEYFKKLFLVLEAKDISYIRRYRLIQTTKVICHSTEKDLAECSREDINEIVAFMHTIYLTPKSKEDFLRDIKHLWKVLLPEEDERGRIDENIVPYSVRHLSARIDKSKEKMRNDRLGWDEFEKIINYFSSDVMMQAYLFLALESLGRPQELLYVKIKDLEIYDNYAKIYISEHGKEGTGFLQCIDSFPYVARWYDQHPLKYDKNAFFFINIKGDKERYEQTKPITINRVLKKACKDLKIDKAITAYSLKRNGVTFRRLKGDSDIEIQHAARWTSTKQLKTYDMSRQEDALKMELIKRGLISTEDQKFKYLKPKIKICMFCNKSNSLTNEICENCSRPLNRDKIREQEKAKEETYSQLKQELEIIKSGKRNAVAMEQFFSLNEVQTLFKTVYKLQKEIEQLKS